MAKVSSKYQVTLPKAIAEQYKIQPGDNIHWVAAGAAIRVIPFSQRSAPDDRESRLRRFDQATARQQKRASSRSGSTKSRGWKREDLYQRGRAR